MPTVLAGNETRPSNVETTNLTKEAAAHGTCQAEIGSEEEPIGRPNGTTIGKEETRTSRAAKQGIGASDILPPRSSMSVEFLFSDQLRGGHSEIKSGENTNYRRMESNGKSVQEQRNSPKEDIS
jgi:hypothetical protein